ncbi:HAD family hydrolase [Rubrivirga marina]|uniref:Haloacid dehalogenase n=1 Tax=Rubrivirga marina TaxID=1196024 RepID=A0A271IVD8_9BACT|nr:HAD family hydrolase [Rubrivirga marina]PAP75221.1 hypothetical protein BSZ37_01570 [Rubrivirga marina]
MPEATTAFHNRIALVFDFDDTLAPDTYEALLAKLGVDPEAFDREKVGPLAEDGWDKTLARFYRIVEEAQGRDDLTLDRAFCQELGESIDLFPGVPEMFDHVTDWAHAIADDVDVEFYLLSGGFVDAQRHAPIAERFEAMYGAEFHFADDGAAACCRQMITHSEKTRYLLAIAKGVGVGGSNEPAEVYRDIPEAEWHVPLDQVIYVGDGASDMPVFELMGEHGGIALGVVEDSDGDWKEAEKVNPDRRVQNLAPADYSEGSELMTSLRLAVESMAKLVALRRRSQGE